MKKRDQPNKIVQNVPEKATGKKVMYIQGNSWKQIISKDVVTKVD
jgi:hypothetical protein